VIERGSRNVDQEVRQSSDQEFHCLSILLFFREIAG